jgi:hypothetical protein
MATMQIDRDDGGPGMIDTDIHLTRPLDSRIPGGAA